jgi:hypothetical protein
MRGIWERMHQLPQGQECGGPVFFHKASSIGYAACFRARPQPLNSSGAKRMEIYSHFVRKISLMVAIDKHEQKAIEE